MVSVVIVANLRKVAAQFWPQKMNPSQVGIVVALSEPAS